MNTNPVQAPVVDPNQAVDTQAYVPTYKIKPEFQQAVLKAIGKFPFNQIQAVMQAIKVDTMDHNTLTQIMNAIGAFPYENVAGVLTNVNNFIEMIQPEAPVVEDVAPDEAPVAEEAPAEEAVAEEAVAEEAPAEEAPAEEAVAEEVKA